MKVFISHSSRDKWVARKISEDLIRIGVETFLDEKDLETGASIDDSIDMHLKDCDEILILLSPTSLNSHWVLIEVGGAKALGKRLVPILMHIGSNEIPAPIQKHLARELNEIEKYYVEVRGRMSERSIPKKPLPSEKKVVRRSRLKKLSVNDKVQILESPDRIARPDLGWNPKMDKYCGQIATVMQVYSDERFAILDIDEGKYSWAFEWLSKQ